MDLAGCYAFLHTEPGPGFDWCFLIANVLPALIGAIPVTFFLLVVSGVLGNLLAIPVALARVSRNPMLWMPSYAFILLMRGTPLLVQIYLIYYGLGQVFGEMSLFGQPLMRALPFLRDAMYYAIFALTLNTAGYTGEILRGAILAVPHGEIEAGKAFGMSNWMIFRRITLPRAIRICLPTMSTETILLLKATSLASTITVYEVLGMAQFIRQQSFRTYETLIGAGIVYVVLVFLLTRLLNWLERYLNKDRERPVSIPLAQAASAGPR
jgi:polar amino acid transport system permease protein/octopine/nopaline transport system permease protein